MNPTCKHSHSSHDHQKALSAALWIAGVFMIAEIIGGWVANSLALISDALHMFVDIGAFLLSIIALRLARRPRTPSMSYGYQRAETLGALASALSLWILSGFLIYEAIIRLWHPEEVKGPIVFFIAILGLFANIFMMKTLHSGQDHNLNVKAAYLHVIGDLLGSVGVILGGFILWFTHWNPIDPIITILFTSVILYSSGKIIKKTVCILMESVPDHIDSLEIQKDLESLDGVKEVHDLHIWSVSSEKTALSVHIISNTPGQTLNAAHLLIEKKYSIHHMTVQVEDPSSFEPRFCYDCEKT